VSFLKAMVRLTDRLRQLDWGSEFRGFCLRYLLWPPNAWNAWQARPPWYRFARVLLDYLYVAVLLFILYLSARAFMSTYWYVGLILLALVPVKMLIIMGRLQIAYQVLRAQQGGHPPHA